MNANLQLIISKLGLSEDVVITDFCSALEMEPDLNLSSIFTGTVTNASTIPWKNNLIEGEDLGEVTFYKITNTLNWNFSYSSFQLDQPEVYLRVESTGAEGSEITAMFLCSIPFQGDSIPVMIIKVGDSIEFSLYIDNSESKYLAFSRLESMFQISALRDQYPESFQTLSGLDCKKLTWNYNYADGRACDIWNLTIEENDEKHIYDYRRDFDVTGNKWLPEKQPLDIRLFEEVFKEHGNSENVWGPWLMYTGDTAAIENVIDKYPELGNLIVEKG